MTGGAISAGIAPHAVGINGGWALVFVVAATLVASLVRGTSKR
jgi:hypothetical protein